MTCARGDGILVVSFGNFHVQLDFCRQKESRIGLPYTYGLTYGDALGITRCFGWSLGHKIYRCWIGYRNESYVPTGARKW